VAVWRYGCVDSDPGVYPKDLRAWHASAAVAPDALQSAANPSTLASMASPLVAAFWPRLRSIRGLLAIDVLSLTVAGDGCVMLTKAYWKLIKSVSIGVLVFKIIY